MEETDPGEQLPPLQYGPTDWPYWRGPTQDGKVPADTGFDQEWTTLENEKWRVEVPGRGHSSPVVYGNQIFLTTADDQKQVQSILSYDRDSGGLLWEKPVHEGNFPSPRDLHAKSTNATPTVACDGERAFALFLNDEQLYLTAFSLEGEQLWQTATGPFISRFGLAPSPVLYKSYVIVVSEHSGGGYIAAIHRKTGKLAWRIKRTRNDSYSTPAIFNINGEDHMILSGELQVTSYDPATGKERWSVPGTADSTCGTAVRWEELIFASGGYPQKQTVAIEVNGTAQELWQTREAFYIPSMITFKGHLFGVNGDGIAYCWEGRTGKQIYKARMSGASTASPVLVGDQVIVISEGADCSILKQNVEKLEVVTERSFGSNAMATPAISGDHMYLRVAEGAGDDRQEFLVCLEK
ncbi:MAG: PQQ-binding-like beta-propeller repeat protein [Planctomycetaceae bacterium]